MDVWQAGNNCAETTLHLIILPLKPMADSNTETLLASYSSLRRRFRIYIVIIILLLLGVLIYALFARTRAGKSDQSAADLLRALDSVSYTAKTFENANGRLVSDNVALIAKNEGVLREMSATVFNLKSDQEKLVKQVNYMTVVKQQVRYDSVFVRYDTSGKIPLIAAGRSDSIGVPQAFSLSDSMSGIYGRVTKTGVALDSIWVYNDIYLRHGVRKTGMLGLGREDFVQAINTNPRVRTLGLATATYRQKPSAWNRWIKPVAAGVIGAAIGYKVAKF